MMTPQETKSGIATAELNNIPTYRKGVKVFPFSKSSNTSSRGGSGVHLDGRGDGTDELPKCDTKKFRKHDPE